MSKKLIPILLGGALVIASILGVVAYREAYAQTSTPAAPSTSVTTPSISGSPVNNDFGRHGFGDVSNANLASALGVTTDQLNTAYQKANNDALTQAVSKGLITQAQADQIRSNGSAFPLGDRWSGWLSQNGIDYNSLLASALGISTDKLQAASIQAYNTGIDQSVTNGQLTQTQADLLKGQYALSNNKDFQTSMQSAFQAAVQKAVTSGVITQAQADQILKNASGMSFMGFGGKGGIPGLEGPHGHGGHGFGGGAVAPNTTTPASPTTTP